MRITPEQVLSSDIRVKERPIETWSSNIWFISVSARFYWKTAGFCEMCSSFFLKAVVVQHRQLHMAITFCNTYVGDMLMIHERKKRISQMLKSITGEFEKLSVKNSMHVKKKRTI